MSPIDDRPTSSRDAPVNLGPQCLPGRYRCVYCLHRFELVSVCPNCGEHSTIVRMSSTAIISCNHCGGSMLQPI
jgi:predicted nucleic acid-binding Zn ribbon protein